MATFNVTTTGIGAGSLADAIGFAELIAGTDTIVVTAAANGAITNAPVITQSLVFNIAASTTVRYAGHFNGAGTTTLGGVGQLTLEGATTSTWGLFVINAGTLQVDTTLDTAGGAGAVTVNANGCLSGTGTVGQVTVASNGVLNAGSTVGTLRTGNLAMDTSAILYMDLRTASQDKVQVTGTVNLGGATLTFDTTGFTNAGGERFTLIDNDGTDAVVGTFAGLAEGATVDVAGTSFRISYVGGTGNDVVLTSTVAAPAPPAPAPAPPPPPSAPPESVVVASPAGGPLQGTPGNDYMMGRNGDDVFRPGGGSDVLIGGVGRDTVELTGARDAYIIRHLGNGLYQVTGNGGSFTTADIERITFADGVLVLPTPAQRNVAAMYNVLLGRQPDENGLDFHANLYESVSPRSLIRGIVNSQEFKDKVLAGPDPSQTFLTYMYEVGLGRKADAAGLAVWAEFLARTPAPDNYVFAAQAFLESQEMQIRLTGMLDSGIFLPG